MGEGEEGDLKVYKRRFLSTRRGGHEACDCEGGIWTSRGTNNKYSDVDGRMKVFPRVQGGE